MFGVGFGHQAVEHLAVQLDHAFAILRFADTRPTDLKHQSSCQRASGASTFEIAW